MGRATCWCRNCIGPGRCAGAPPVSLLLPFNRLRDVLSPTNQVCACMRRGPDALVRARMRRAPDSSRAATSGASSSRFFRPRPSSGSWSPTRGRSTSRCGRARAARETKTGSQSFRRRCSAPRPRSRRAKPASVPARTRPRQGSRNVRPRGRGHGLECCVRGAYRSGAYADTHACLHAFARMRTQT